MAQLLHESGVRACSGLAASTCRAKTKAHDNRNPIMTSRHPIADFDPAATVLADDLGTLVEHLNDDLAGELQSTVMYVRYAAFLRGLHRSDLSKLFQTDISDEQRHARLLADRISSLGGVPTTTRRPVRPAVGAYQMLRNIFEAAARAVDGYTARVTEAEVHGEHDLKVELEQLLADATRHRDEVGKVLERWTPTGIDTPES
jgi:bacterioferritin